MDWSANTPARSEWKARSAGEPPSGWSFPWRGKPSMSAKGSILIIDDEEEVRESLEELLKLEGYQPVAAATGEDGLKKAEDRLFDLVLLDINLPDQNGIDVLKSLKRDSPDTGVIMITA